MYYYKHPQKGEIVTLLTIGAVLVIGFSTIVSSLFLKNPKNKVASNPRASFDCSGACGCYPDGSEKACPNDNPPPESNPTPEQSQNPLDNWNAYTQAPQEFQNIPSSKGNIPSGLNFNSGVDWLSGFSNWNSPELTSSPERTFLNGPSDLSVQPEKTFLNPSSSSHEFTPLGGNFTNPSDWLAGLPPQGPTPDLFPNEILQRDANGKWVSDDGVSFQLLGQQILFPPETPAPPFDVKGWLTHVQENYPTAEPIPNEIVQISPVHPNTTDPFGANYVGPDLSSQPRSAPPDWFQFNIPTPEPIALYTNTQPQPTEAPTPETQPTPPTFTYPMSLTLTYSVSPTPVIQSSTSIAQGSTNSFDATEMLRKHDEMQTWCNTNPDECKNRLAQNDHELVAIGIIAPVVLATAVTVPIWGPPAAAAVNTASIYAYVTGATAASVALANASPQTQQVVQAVARYAPPILEGVGLTATALACQNENQDACQQGFALGSTYLGAQQAAGSLANAARNVNKLYQPPPGVNAGDITEIYGRFKPQNPNSWDPYPIQQQAKEYLAAGDANGAFRCLSQYCQSNGIQVQKVQALYTENDNIVAGMYRPGGKGLFGTTYGPGTIEIGQTNSKGQLIPQLAQASTFSHEVGHAIDMSNIPNISLAQTEARQHYVSSLNYKAMGNQYVSEQYYNNAIRFSTGKYPSPPDVQLTQVNRISSPASSIANARSWNELYKGIQNTGGLQGSKASYSPNQLINIIKDVRSNPNNINTITNAGGLRSKVIQMLNQGY